jgi:hypothetical protein
MTKKALFVVGVFALSAAAACAQMKSYSSPKPQAGAGALTPVDAIVCEEKECVHEVTVDESQSPCKAVVHPQIMAVKTNHDVKVVWQLKAPGYEFVSVTFKDQDKSYVAENKAFLARVKVPSKDQFYEMHVGKTEASYKDKNTLDGSWMYNIVVKKGDKTCKIDPPVINEM